MSDIKLLDCTLRDGGYVNNWKFGNDTICKLVQGLADSRMDIIEVGFLKNEPYEIDRTVFNDVNQLTDIIGEKRQGSLYAAMAEVLNPLATDQIVPRSENTIDMIRAIVWKTKHIDGGKGIAVDALNEGYEYLKSVKDKGYEICVQPARIDQYSKSEFRKMLEKFSNLDPYAIYIVDSWGTLDTNRIMEYVHIADKELDKNIAIGYHGHNNFMQAFGVAQEFLKIDTGRKLIVDSSIYGMGRGAGNLNSEIIATYLNRNYCKSYNINILIDLYEKYIEPIYASSPWGYSIAGYLTAQYGCNPRFANYYGGDNKISAKKMIKIYENLTDEEKVLFDVEKAKNFITQYAE